MTITKRVDVAVAMRGARTLTLGSGVPLSADSLHQYKFPSAAAPATMPSCCDPSEGLVTRAVSPWLRWRACVPNPLASDSNVYVVPLPSSAQNGAMTRVLCGNGAGAGVDMAADTPSDDDDADADIDAGEVAVPADAEPRRGDAALAAAAAADDNGDGGIVVVVVKDARRRVELDCENGL